MAFMFALESFFVYPIADGLDLVRSDGSRQGEEC